MFPQKLGISIDSAEAEEPVGPKTESSEADEDPEDEDEDDPEATTQ